MMDRYGKNRSQYLTKITGVAACVVLFATMAVVSLSVLMRIFFNSPIAGVTDIVSLLNALAVAFAISVAERRRKHIRVDFVREYLPPRIGKTIYFFMSLLAMLVIVVISWRFFLYIFSTLQHVVRPGLWIFPLACCFVPVLSV
jgi:TRAP-type C4-dicarboxylate transport system permease small subunit